MKMIRDRTNKNAPAQYGRISVFIKLPPIAEQQ